MHGTLQKRTVLEEKRLWQDLECNNVTLWPQLVTAEFRGSTNSKAYAPAPVLTPTQVLAPEVP